MAGAVDLLRNHQGIRDAYEHAGVVLHRLDSAEGPSDVTDGELAALQASTHELVQGAREICCNPDVSVLAKAAISSIVWPDSLSPIPRGFNGFRQLAGAVGKRERHLDSVDAQLRRLGAPVLIIDPGELHDPEEPDSMRYVLGEADGRGIAFNTATRDGMYAMTASLGLRRVLCGSSSPPTGVHLNWRNKPLDGTVYSGVPELVRADESGLDETVQRAFGPYPSLDEIQTANEYVIGVRHVDRVLAAARDIPGVRRAQMGLKVIAFDAMAAGYEPSFIDTRI